MMILVNFMILLLTAAVYKVQCEVSFMESSAILTCPLADESSGEVQWFKDDKPIKGEKNITYMIQTDDGTVKGFFTCKHEQKNHHFFINAKVCENCHEFSGALVCGVILGDLLITGGVMLIVYSCTQRKRETKDAPRPPNPDYEALNPKTQSKDVYAGIR